MVSDDQINFNDMLLVIYLFGLVVIWTDFSHLGVRSCS